MALNSANVRVYQTGELLYGLTTAAAPTGTGSATTGFTGLGLVSTDGFTEARERSVEDLRVYQNGAVVRSVVTDSSFTISCVFMETNLDTVRVFYGTTVT